MRGDAIDRANRGTNPPPATRKQRRYLRALARRAGIEVPVVAWRHEASDAISRLEVRLSQPSLWEAA